MMAGLFLGSAAFAQMMPDSTVQVVAYWQVGDKYSYQVEQSTSKIEGNDTTVVEKSAEILTFEVLEATDSTYRVLVSYDDFQHSDYARLRAHDALEKAFGKTSLQFITDIYGTYQRMILPENLQEESEAAIEEYAREMCKERGLGEDAMETVKTIVRGLISPEAYSKAAEAEITPLLAFHGTRLDLKREYESSIQQPTLFGEGTIPMTLRFWVDENYTDSTSVVIRTYQEAEKGALAPFIANMLGQMAQNVTSEDVSEGVDYLSKADMTMEDFQLLEVHLDTGWPLFYSFTREVVTRIDDQEQRQVVRKRVTMMD